MNDDLDDQLTEVADADLDFMAEFEALDPHDQYDVLAEMQRLCDEAMAAKQ